MEYQIEITEDECSFRVQKVQANSAREAINLAIISGDEYVSQICRKFDDCILPQPVYDFFNGFSLFEEQDERSNYLK